MADKLKVELQDENGNIYYLHTSADVVFCEDGTTVEAKLNGKIDEADIIQNATTAATDKVPSAAVAKNLQDQITAQNTNLSDLQNTTDKMGVYDVWANGSIAFNVVFRVPVNGGQNRPVFLMMGNIGTNSFMMICTTSFLGDVLSPATCIDIIGNMSSQMTVNINRHENSADQLRINFTTPTNMGARVQVIVPAGRIVNQW